MCLACHVRTLRARVAHVAATLLLELLLVIREGVISFKLGASSDG
jgi:hypothetical protein